MSLGQARLDVVRFTQAGFAVDLVFTAPTAEIAAIKGIASKHRMSINPDDGLPINSPNIHASVVESLLIAQSYPTRTANGEVYMKGHKVLYDGKTYRISENYPDETLGLIVFILDEYGV